MIKIGIAIPTYNEAGNIENLLSQLATVATKHTDTNFTVLVIDDSSPDGTAKLVEASAKKLKKKNFVINCLVRAKKDGLGRAYVFGFKELLKKKHALDYILQMDADLSHKPKYISNFIKKAQKGADFIVASRYIKGGGTPDWPWYRQVLSRGGNVYTRLILGSKISDYTGGFNMYAADLMRHIDVDSLTAGGYGFLIELKYRALRQAQAVQEIPIIFNDREKGSSKIPKSTIFKNLLLVPKIRFQK